MNALMIFPLAPLQSSATVKYGALNDVSNLHRRVLPNTTEVLALRMNFLFALFAFPDV